MSNKKSKYLQSGRLLNYTPYVTLKPLPELIVLIVSCLKKHAFLNLYTYSLRQ